MARSGYSDVNWFLRATRVAPVIAGAALFGGMIGGFAMFAVDSAFNSGLTWDPVSQPRLDARADNQGGAVEQPRKPVRIVGGAIPDPSAGMSAPPPVLPQQRNPAAQDAQISSQLLTSKPLGPATQLQPQTATAAAQQPTRWPDALSRAHQNTPDAQQQNAPPVTAQTSGTNTSGANTSGTNKTDETDGKANNDRAAASADDQDRAYSSRQGRHHRRHTMFGANGWRNDGGDDSATAISSRRQDARTYDRLYDSYGGSRDRSYGRSRNQFYDRARADQGDNGYRSGTRRYGRDEGSGSRVIVREHPEEGDRNQTVDTVRPRSEPFWGGGFFRRDRNDD